MPISDKSLKFPRLAQHSTSTTENSQQDAHIFQQKLRGFVSPGAQKTVMRLRIILATWGARDAQEFLVWARHTQHDCSMG